MEKKNKNRTEIVNPEITLGQHEEYRRREHDPAKCGCTYRGNNLWSCGHVDPE